jgi:hypothetical protein
MPKVGIGGEERAPARVPGPTMHPQAPGYQHYGSAPMGAPPQAALIAGIEGIAKPTLALLGLRAALPVFFYFLPYGLFGDPRVGAMIKEGIRGLVTLLAIIFFLIWFARVYAWIRAARGGTRFSTGMAIGGWFIPFANFVLPYMAVRDAWKRGANDENGFLVAIWWASYLLTIFLAMFYSVLDAVPGMIFGSMGAGAANAMLTGISWTYILAQIGAYGLLFFIVQQLTRRAAAR